MMYDQPTPQLFPCRPDGADPAASRLPTPLLLAFAQNMHAWEGYARLSEAERRTLLARAAKISSPADLSSLVAGLIR